MIARLQSNFVEVDPQRTRLQLNKNGGNSKIRKPYGSKRYENLSDPKDTKTLRIQNIRKPFGEDTKTDLNISGQQQRRQGDYLLLKSSDNTM